MATLDDVRVVAGAFPDVSVAWRTRNGGFAWERGPTKADLATLAGLGRTWPDGLVIGVRTE